MKAKYYFLFSIMAVMTFVIACNNNGSNTNPPAGCCDNAKFFYGGVDTTIYCVPNVITPNSDGYNDELRFKRNSTTQDYSFEVYDASNNIVYFDSAYHNNWSGVDKSGQLLADGKYKYKITHKIGSIIGFVCIITTSNNLTSPKNCLASDPNDPLLQ